MKTMKVMRFNDSSDAPALLACTAPVPQPGRGEILVRIRAAGVTPTELQWYPTTHTKDGGKRAGAILGHEFSGVVEAVGANPDPEKIGREIFGMNDWFAEGAISAKANARIGGETLQRSWQVIPRKTQSSQPSLANLRFARKREPER